MFSSVRVPRGVPWLATALLLCGALLAARRVMLLLGEHTGLQASLDWIILSEAVLPRSAVALLGGAALGLSGVLFQQVLRNPLAEPATVGAAAGAYLALAIATLFAPMLIDVAQVGVAFLGAGCAVLLVLTIASRHAFSPGSVILAGLVVGLYCNAVATGLVLSNGAGFQSLFLWSSGTLVQNGWATSIRMAVELALAAIGSAILVRPLALLDLGEGGASSLGVDLPVVRLLILALATALTAAVVSALGVIGFIGLAAPNLARLSGATRFAPRLLLAPFLGAGLLWLCDGLVQAMPGLASVPTGAAVALIGSPLLLGLLPRLRVAEVAAISPSRSARRPRRWLIAGLILLPVAVGLSLTVGRTALGWEMQGWVASQPFLIWRLPRMLVAVAAGVMLALAGAIIQRVTANPLASPEILGVGAGASAGVIVSLILTPGLAPLWLIGGALLGSLVTLFTLVVIGGRTLRPELLLLGGTALATMLSGLAAAFLASGDPRAFLVAQWLAGTTYLATPTVAGVSWIVAAGLCLPLPFLARWLEILPLGEVTSRGLGLPVRRVRLTLLVLAGTLTTAATLLVGPLGFVGLLAPHAARLLGFTRVRSQMAAAALLAALVMIFADWLGRTLLFPSQLPTGLVVSLLATPYLLVQLARR